MPDIGDRLTLAELISRSQLHDAFLTLRVVDGLIVAIYRAAASGVQEYWQGVPDTEYLVLKHLLNRPDAKVE